MKAKKANYPVKMMARVLGMSRSGFYSWLARDGANDPWVEVREAVWRVWLESDRIFWSPLRARVFARRAFRHNALPRAQVHVGAGDSRYRPHSTIGDKVPGEVMDAFFERMKPVEVAVERQGCVEKMVA